MRKRVWKQVQRRDRYKAARRKKRIHGPVRSIHSAMKDCLGGHVSADRLPKYMHSSARKRHGLQQPRKG
jgi:hypothetical protein